MVKKLLVLLLVVPLCVVAADDEVVGYQDFDQLAFVTERADRLQSKLAAVTAERDELALALTKKAPYGEYDHDAASTEYAAQERARVLAIQHEAREQEIAEKDKLIAQLQARAGRIQAAWERGQSLLNDRTSRADAVHRRDEESIALLRREKHALATMIDKNEASLAALQDDLSMIVEDFAQKQDEAARENAAQIERTERAHAVYDDDMRQARAAARRMHQEREQAENKRREVERDAWRAAHQASVAREVALREQLQAAQMVPPKFVVRFNGMGGLFEREFGGEGSLS